MNDRELDDFHMYFLSAAQESCELAAKALSQGRRAKAQDLYLDAMFNHSKLPGWFTDAELDNNMKKLGEMLTRGF